MLAVQLKQEGADLYVRFSASKKCKYWSKKEGPMRTCKSGKRKQLTAVGEMYGYASSLEFHSSEAKFGDWLQLGDGSGTWMYALGYVLLEKFAPGGKPFQTKPTQRTQMKKTSKI